MKIEDYGLVFTPQEYGIDYSKSPQAVVLKDSVKIYFSHCLPDKSKIVSRVGCVEFSKDFSKIITVSKDVIKLGEKGTFDEHGIFPFSPFVDDKRLLAFTSGWSRRQSVSVETAIGIAESVDGGETFNRVGDGPVLCSSLHEPFLVVDGFVVKKKSHEYCMFYIYGVDWKHYPDSNQPERTYKIGMAISVDLINWNKCGKQLICDVIENEAQALPTVIYWKNKWRMFFCYRSTVNFRTEKKCAYKIGYATSNDMLSWNRDDSKIKLPVTEWNSEMQCYPNVFNIGDELFLAYNGNHFGRYGFGIVKVEIGDDE